jgi:hypothetical protein
VVYHHRFLLHFLLGLKVVLLFVVDLLHLVVCWRDFVVDMIVVLVSMIVVGVFVVFLCVVFEMVGVLVVREMVIGVVLVGFFLVIVDWA